MRRTIIASLLVLETLLATAIAACSVGLARTVVANDRVAAVAHALEHSTRTLAALELRVSIRRRA